MNTYIPHIFFVLYLGCDSSISHTHTYIHSIKIKCITSRFWSHILGCDKCAIITELHSYPKSLRNLSSHSYREHSKNTQFGCVHVCVVWVCCVDVLNSEHDLWNSIKHTEWDGRYINRLNDALCYPISIFCSKKGFGSSCVFTRARIIYWTRICQAGCVQQKSG